MSHETPLSTIVFQKTDGSTGELAIHDTDAIHNETGSVNSDNIATGAVKTEDIASQAVTSDKLANNAVNTVNIVDHAITKDKIAKDITDAWDSASEDISSKIVCESGVTVDTASFVRTSHYAQFTMTFRKSSAMTAGADYILCTLPEEYRPKSSTIIGNYGITGLIYGNGQIRIAPVSNMSSNSYTRVSTGLFLI